MPGVETAPAATEPVQELVRAFATVVADEQLAEVRDAQTQLAQAEARRRLAAQQVRRLEELAKGAVAPLKELEAARADAAAASAEATRASKVLAGFGADQDHAPLADGEQWVIARVAQVDVPHIAAGAPAAFSADAFPERELPARVDAGPAYVDPATRTAPVRLRVRDPAQQLRPGMTGAVTLEMGAPHDAVVVPVAAVVYDDARAAGTRSARSSSASCGATGSRSRAESRPGRVSSSPAPRACSRRRGCRPKKRSRWRVPSGGERAPCVSPRWSGVRSDT